MKVLRRQNRTVEATCISENRKLLHWFRTNVKKSPAGDRAM
jgi:hypothetical protein